jgi:hypothetical protein
MENGKVYTIMAAPYHPISNDGKQERLKLLQKFKSLVLSTIDPSLKWHKIDQRSFIHGPPEIIWQMAHPMTRKRNPIPKK